MKKIVYILALVLEFAAFIGVYIIHYFTKRKLGMVRYLNYKNMIWEQNYLVNTLKIVCVIIVVVLTIVVLIFFLKKRKEASWLTVAMNIFMIVFTILYGAYTFISSTDTMADYYFISILLFLVAVIQIIKTGVAVQMTKGSTK